MGPTTRSLKNFGIRLSHSEYYNNLQKIVHRYQMILGKDVGHDKKENLWYPFVTFRIKQKSSENSTEIPNDATEG